MINRLQHFLAYECGPIDDIADGGIPWRKDMSNFLKSIGIGVLNPCDKPSDMIKETPDTHKYLRNLAEYHRFDELTRFMKSIVSIDLHMVDLSNFIIVYVDKNAHMCGSYCELTYSCLEHKPVIICSKQGKQNIPHWIYGITETHRTFFNNWIEVKRYIRGVAYDTLGYPAENDGWRFLDYNKVF